MVNGIPLLRSLWTSYITIFFLLDAWFLVKLHLSWSIKFSLRTTDSDWWVDYSFVELKIGKYNSVLLKVDNTTNIQHAYLVLSVEPSLSRTQMNKLYYQLLLSQLLLVIFSWPSFINYLCTTDLIATWKSSLMRRF